MKKKATTLLNLFTIISLLLLSGCSFDQSIEKDPSPVSQQTIELATSHAKFESYENIEELENTADVIVKVKFTGDREIQNFEQNGVIIDSAAKSIVKVNKVYKGNVQKNSTILVYEPGFLENDTYQNVEGYKNMNEKGNYILFLRENPDNTFVSLGVYQGKYDLNITKPVKKVKPSMTQEEFESLDFVGEEPDHFNKLKEEVLQKYND
mgnify:CR=1 FL=1